MKTKRIIKETEIPVVYMPGEMTFIPDNNESNKLQRLYKLAEKVPLSKRQAEAFIGSRTRLERLTGKSNEAVPLRPL